MKIIRKKLSRNAFRKWLSSAVGVVLTSVVFVQDINAIKINVNDPKLLSHMITSSQLVFPKGQYLVEYTVSDKKSEDFQPIRKTIWAMSLEGNTTKGRKIGDFNQLFELLNGCQYCISTLDVNPAYAILGLLIEQPDSPVELAFLLDKLKSVAIFHSIEDGSGFMHQGNSSIGHIPLAKKRSV
jgi:hypothetical protein